MIPSRVAYFGSALTVYQRGWMIDSQHDSDMYVRTTSISKGMDD